MDQFICSLLSMQSDSLPFVRFQDQTVFPIEQITHTEYNRQHDADDQKSKAQTQGHADDRKMRLAGCVEPVGAAAKT